MTLPVHQFASVLRTHSPLPQICHLPIPTDQPTLIWIYFDLFQELVAKYSQQMVKGMLQLLSNCPAETAHLRKELLIAAKHILTTDLRSRM